MNSILKYYINNLTIEQINNLAIKNDIFLNETELEFTYQFVKKNWQTIIANHGNFDITKYKTHYSNENFIKIMNLYKKTIQKYANYL